MPSSGYVADSFVSGEQPSTAKWNELWSNDASFNSGNGFNDNIIVTRHFATSGLQIIDKSYNPMKISAYRNASEAVGDGGVVLFDSVNFDSGSNYNASNGRITATQACYLQVQSMVSSQATPTSFFMAAIFKNGSLWKYGSTFSLGTSAPQSCVADLVPLAINDYVTINIHTGSTTNLNVGQQFTYVSAFMVSNT